MSDNNKTVRRSQVITGQGPGGILDIGQESFICIDTSQWNVIKCSTIRLPRLESKTGATLGFKSPPVKQGFSDFNPATLPYYRFPRWLFCPKCKSMVKWTAAMEKQIGDNGVPTCLSCNGNKPPVLAPMRFILVCKSGHIGDVDWNKWAHSRSDKATKGQCSFNPPKLKFKTASGGASDLSSLSVACKECGAYRSLADLTNPAQMKSAGIFCSGKQPWQYFEDLPPICKDECRAEQRGASNIYYSQTLSALDIPGLQEDTTVSDEDTTTAILNHPNFAFVKMLADAETEPLEAPHVKLAAGQVANDLNLELDVILDQLGCGDPLPPPTEASSDDGEQSLRRGEWPWLIKDNNAAHLNTSIEPLADSNTASKELTKVIDTIILAKKLREVRCLRGFSRVDPSGDAIPPDLDGSRRWLPAIEIFGEGVFVKFDEYAIHLWSQQEKVIARLTKLQERFDESEGITSILPTPTPRLVMLHTFAHLLIRQLCFECGYSASSLRERIYCDEPDQPTGPMAGVMIYTADTDSEGSLGGLCRQGEESRFSATLLSALDRGSWCSSDPVCSEVEGQGLGGLNRAACHACSLVAETSCTMFNCLLDRELVTGTEIGYFRETIEKLNSLNTH